MNLITSVLLMGCNTHQAALLETIQRGGLRILSRGCTPHRTAYLLGAGGDRQPFSWSKKYWMLMKQPLNALLSQTRAEIPDYYRAATVLHSSSAEIRNPACSSHTLHYTLELTKKDAYLTSCVCCVFMFCGIFIVCMVVCKCMIVFVNVSLLIL